MNEPDPIRIAHVSVDESVEQLVLATLRSGQLAQGPMVARLEENFASLCGVTYAVAVANGTLALIAALQALGIGPGDEVVTSPFTFVATLNAILACGAVARFADIDPVTFTLDPDAVEEALTSRTRVIMPVHLYGQPADMPRFSTLAKKYGALIVEDAAQAHGASIDGRAVGSYGVGCFSLYATKNITSGEGGIVTTDNVEIADAIRRLRNAGMRARYDYAQIGFNYRLTDVHAAIALPQLEKLDATNERRRKNAARLNDALAGIEGLTTPRVAVGRNHVFHQYTVRVTRDARLDRDQLAAALAARGIETTICYPRVVYDYDCFRAHPGVAPASVPEAERAAHEVLSLPVHPNLSASDVERIADEVRGALCGAEIGP